MPFDGAPPAGEHRTVAAKKLPSKEAPRIHKVEVWPDLNNVDADPVRAAFEVLTGKSPDDHWPSFFVFIEAVRTVLVPTTERSEWLAKATKHVTHQSYDDRVNRGLMKLTMVAWKPNPEQVRRALCLEDRKFLALTDSHVSRAFAYYTPEKKTGKGNLSLASVLAQLSIFVGAFKCTRSETENAAVRERAADKLRKAQARAMLK